MIGCCLLYAIMVVFCWCIVGFGARCRIVFSASQCLAGKVHSFRCVFGQRRRRKRRLYFVFMALFTTVQYAYILRVSMHAELFEKTNAAELCTYRRRIVVCRIYFRVCINEVSFRSFARSTRRNAVTARPPPATNPRFSSPANASLSLSLSLLCTSFTLC